MERANLPISAYCREGLFLNLCRACIILVYFPFVQADFTLARIAEEGVSECQERRNKDYKPKIRVGLRMRTPRRPSNKEAVDYSECELESKRESINSESTLEFGQDNRTDWDLQALWTQGTLNSHIQVGHQVNRLSEQARETTMAQKSEQSSIERMMDMFLQMRQEEQTRDNRREQDILEREERKEREEREREVRREDSHVQLIAQLKEAQQGDHKPAKVAKNV